MAGRVKVKGVIGNTHYMKPHMIWETKERQGEKKKVPFITFKMWADDYTLPLIQGNNGKQRYDRSPIQVILPESQRGISLFKNLAAGRHVLIYGKLTHRPNSVLDQEKAQAALDAFTKDKDYKKYEIATKEATTVYANPVIYMEDIEFLDEQPLYVAERVINVLKGECNVITDEQANQYFSAFEKYWEGLRKTTEERIVEDKTTKTEPVPEPTDPDDLGLQ